MGSFMKFSPTREVSMRGQAVDITIPKSKVSRNHKISPVTPLYLSILIKKPLWVPNEAQTLKKHSNIYFTPCKLATYPTKPD